MSGKKILAWICMLSFIGGYANVYGIMRVSFTLTHFTGCISRLAMTGTDIQFDKHFYQLITCLFLFVLGSILAGYFIGERRFNLKKRYGLIFIGMGIILTFIFLITKESTICVYILSLVVGIQNGLFITYKGILVRTSHITGCLSDLGVYIGYFLKGKDFDRWKIFYHFINIVSFFAGGFISKIIFNFYDKKSVYFISLGYILVGIIYLGIKKCFVDFFIKYIFQFFLFFSNKKIEKRND